MDWFPTWGCRQQMREVYHEASRKRDGSLVSSLESGCGVMEMVAMDQWDGKTNKVGPSRTRKTHKQERQKDKSEETISHEEA